MEDGAIGVRSANATATVSSSPNETATARHPDLGERIVQDPRQDGVNTASYQLYIYDKCF